MTQGVNKQWIDTGYKQYLVRGDTFTLTGDITTTKKIEPGIYKVDKHMGNIIFTKHGVMSDEILELPNPVYQKVLSEASQFWTNEMKNKFSRYNLVYKRGILLYGTPGTGKTCIIMKVMEKIVNLGGIVLLDPNPILISEAVKGIRDVEGDNKPVLVVFEELEDVLGYAEQQLLQLLDGEEQVDNIVYVAATNYIDDIPPRIKNRPSRFATVLEVGPPPAEARRNYIESKLHADDVDKVNVDDWVEQTEGLTIDHLKDIVVSVLCFDHSIDDAVTKARGMTAEEDF